MNLADIAIATRAGWAPPPCYGVGCPQRARCARYRAVETSDAPRIDSCATGWDRRPGYAPVQREMPAPELAGVDDEGGID